MDARSQQRGAHIDTPRATSIAPIGPGRSRAAGRSRSGLARMLGLLLLVSLASMPAQVMAQGADKDTGAKAGAKDSPEKLPKLSDLSEAQQKRLAGRVEAGRVLYNEGIFEKALAAFEEAYSVYPHPDVLYRVAECQEKLGQYNKAIKNYRTFLRQSPDAPDRNKIEGIIASLEKRMKPSTSKLSFKTKPEGAAVYVDGTQVGSAPLEHELKAGKHMIRVELEGYTTVEEEIEAEEGQKLMLRYQLSRAAVADKGDDKGDKKVDDTKKPDDPEPIEDPGPGIDLTMPLITTGAAALTTGAAITFFLLYNGASADVDAIASRKGRIERPEDYNSTVSRRNTFGYLAISTSVLAAGAIGTAVYFWITAEPRETRPPASTAWQLLPTLQPAQGQAGLQLFKRF